MSQKNRLKKRREGERVKADERLRQRQLEELRRNLEEANRISAENLADRIKGAGFQCLRCGECCTGDENSVAIFPFEVRRIMGVTGESWHETVEPPSIGEWDSRGRFHTLEWRIRKCGKSCKFYTPGGCGIYEARPLLCSTYPFYIAEGELRCSECRGLGRAIDAEDAGKIAALLKERNIIEIQEAIQLLEKYRDFQRGHGRPGEGEGACIVHDSEGEHEIDWEMLPDLRSILKI
jgi:hypothetical protein